MKLQVVWITICLLGIIPSIVKGQVLQNGGNAFIEQSALKTETIFHNGKQVELLTPQQNANIHTGTHGPQSNQYFSNIPTQLFNYNNRLSEVKPNERLVQYDPNINLLQSANNVRYHQQPLSYNKPQVFQDSQYIVGNKGEFANPQGNFQLRTTEPQNLKPQFQNVIQSPHTPLHIYPQFDTVPQNVAFNQHTSNIPISFSEPLTYNTQYQPLSYGHHVQQNILPAQQNIHPTAYINNQQKYYHSTQQGRIDAPFEKLRISPSQSIQALPSISNTQNVKIPLQSKHTQFIIPTQNNQQRAAIKSVDSKYYVPQTFKKPIVPQTQHFLPQIQYHQPSAKVHQEKEEPKIPVKSVKSKLIIKESPAEEKHEHREQTKGEIIHEEENDEEVFEKSYNDAAKGFPAYQSRKNEKYESKDREDDREFNEFDFLPNKFSPEDIEKSAKYANLGSKYSKHDSSSEDDSDEDEEEDECPYKKSHHGGYDKNKRQSDDTEEYKPKRSNNYDYNTKHKRCNRKANFKDTKVNKSNKYKDSYKAHDTKDSQYIPSSIRSYVHKSGPSVSDSYAGNSSPQASLSRPASDSKFVEPKYQYGFAPIAFAGHTQTVSEIATGEDSPGTMTKVYKENWVISKSSKTESAF